MNVNEMLAVCDWSDVRARAMLLDLLHDEGRFEEEELAGWSGRPLRWESDLALLRCDTDNEEREDCPFCGSSFEPPQRGWCEHVLLAQDGSQIDLVLDPDGHFRRVEGVPLFCHEHRAIRALPEALRRQVRFLIGFARSVVLPVQLTPTGRQTVLTCCSAEYDILHEDYPSPNPTATTNEPAPPLEDSMRARRRLLGEVTISAVCCLDPLAYLQRLQNLIRQREAAGCSLPVPTSNRMVAASTS